MKKICLLNKDNTCKVISMNKHFDISDVKYVLIPLNGIDAHILVKPNEYMNFTKAIVCYEPEIVISNDFYDDVDETNYWLNKITIEITNIVDFYNFLHSINRIEYSNSFTNEYDLYNEIEGNYISIKSMDIKLFQNNLLIYELHYTAKCRNDEFDISSYKLLDELKPIYRLFKNKDNKYLSIKNNKWNLVDYPEENSLVGVYLDNTCSICIFPDHVLKILAVISSIEYRKIIYSKYQKSSAINKYEDLNDLIYNKINNMSISDDDIESFVNSDAIDLYVDTGNMIECYRPFDDIGDYQNLSQTIEFLIYLSVIVMNTSFGFNMLYGADDSNELIIDTLFIVNIYFISINKRKITIVSCKNKNISLDSIVKLIYHNYLS